MKSRLFVAIDGGASKTRLAAYDVNDKLILELFDGPINLFCNEENAVEDTLVRLLSPLKKHATPENIGIALSAAGISKAGAKKTFTNMINKGCRGAKSIVIGDAEAALYSVNDTGTGVLLISGTGSICYGKDESGRIQRCGGYGHIASDGGSGTWISIKAIEYAFMAHDGIKEKTPLYEHVFNYFEAAGPRDLLDKIHTDIFPKKYIADLCRTVEQCAVELNDSNALKILDLATDELYLLVKGVITGLDFTETIPLLFIGSVASKCEIIRNGLYKKLNKQYNIELTDAMSDCAVKGALHLAKKLF